jgi:hypothetical protein
VIAPSIFSFSVFSPQNLVQPSEPHFQFLFSWIMDSQVGHQPGVEVRFFALEDSTTSGVAK